MGSVLDRIDDDLRAWIESQPMFFVARKWPPDFDVLCV